jgi:hypothetical protein
VPQEKVEYHSAAVSLPSALFGDSGCLQSMDDRFVDRRNMAFL